MLSAKVQRPANTTAYAVGQIIGNSTVAGSMVPLKFVAAAPIGRSGFIRRIRLKTDDANWLNATIRVHLYEMSPTFANGDGGNWAAGTNESNYIGYADITLDRQFSDLVKGIGVPAAGNEINFSTVGGDTIYGVLEARTAVTPASAKNFTVTLEGLDD